MSDTRSQLEAAVAHARSEVERRRSHRTLELLGRALQWLDRPDEARPCFAEAARQVEDRFEGRGRGSASSRAQTAGLWWNAGDREAAVAWARRALDQPDPASETANAALRATLAYLVGDPATAVASAAGLPAEHSNAHAAAALAAGEPQRARELLLATDYVRRTPPWESTGHRPLAPHDWLYETYAVEAGGAPPTRADVLAALGR